MYGWEKCLGKRSVLDCFCIRVLQISLHYVAPYLLVSKLWIASVGPFPWRVAIAVEVVFFIWMARAILPRLHSTPPMLEPCRTAVEGEWTSYLECVSESGYAIDKFFSGWFLGADVRRIPYNKILAWTSNLMYGKDPSDLEPSSRKSLNKVVDDMCTRFDLKPPSGDDPSINFMNMWSEPLLIYQRSMLQYAIGSLLPRVAAASVFHYVLGLRRICCEETGMYYWWRAGKNDEPQDQLPDLFFFHGLCGYTGYVPLLVALLSAPSRGAVLFEIEDVSMCLNFSRPMTKEGVVKTARDAEERLRAARGGMARSCIIFGHSLGSCAAAQLIEEPPTTIAGVALIDPVSILLMLPDVAHGFLHRIPQTLFDWFCFLWCATEPGIAQYFRRRFFW